MAVSPPTIELTDGHAHVWPSAQTERSRSGIVRLLGAGVAAAVVLAIWWGVTAAEVWSDLILPSPGQVWRAFVQSITSEGNRRGLSGHFLWEHLWASLWRILKGVAWGAVVGIPLGLLLGLSRLAELVVEPVVSFLRSLPPLGYFSLLIIWFGIDDTSKVWLLFIAAFPPIALSVAGGVVATRAERVNAALTLGAGRLSVLRHVVIPSALPDLVTGVRIAVGFTWGTIVAAETSNGIPGIGGLAWATKKELRADIAILCIIVIGITAVILDTALKTLQRRIVPWSGRA